MKKLSVLAVLVFVVLAGIWIGCRCAPLVSPTPVEPSPTEVIEPTPTEKIEEPTPTPVPPAPTPVPPTPTPEPTAAPTSELSRYIGLSPGEVQQLREQCLRENPDSLCLPLPVDPTQLGVEVIAAHTFGSDGTRFETIVFKVPVGTIVVAPVGGEILYFGREYGGEGEGFYNPTIRFGGGRELILIFALDAFRLTQDELHNDFVPLGTALFTVKRPDAIVLEEGMTWLDQSERPVDFQVMLWLWKPNEGRSFLSITEADLLTDDQGRIIFVLP